MHYYIERELLPSLVLFVVGFVSVALMMLVLFVVGKAATQLAHSVILSAGRSPVQLYSTKRSVRAQ